MGWPGIKKSPLAVLHTASFVWNGWMIAGHIISPFNKGPPSPWTKKLSTPAPRPHSFRSTSLDTQKRCSQSDNLGQQQPRRESYGMTRVQKLFRRESYQDLQYLRYEKAISAMDFPTFWCDIAGTWISTRYIRIQVI